MAEGREGREERQNRGEKAANLYQHSAAVLRNSTNSTTGCIRAAYGVHIATLCRGFKIGSETGRAQYPLGRGMEIVRERERVGGGGEVFDWRVFKW